MASLPEVPAQVPRQHSHLGQRFGLWLFELIGWRFVGEFPAQQKMIMAVAPHTSNWDFIIGVIAKLALDVKLHFLGKHTIFVWPLKPILLSLGGIAVDRRSAHGVVGQMVDQFNQHEQLILALSPEGTRSKVEHWRTGFLQIARQANVPVFPIQFNFKKKQIEFMPLRYIGDDIDRELAEFKALFDANSAKKPQLF
ncbi:lysophospholipid acyltransferase family protein [Thalassotalea ponticola]|uniref:lysophospholipid acyltransferase family protein n=1 Tax=Thalassotalea ponticola TaxID=1523392 RepID=UPI0025B2BD3B|nr:lysophospholipid acyltransferase family protein [Thalassotalea ponticola]MDN3653181.1 lysophospholipid acyltransferase family protein [Thalassotalea ponticola]